MAKKKAPPFTPIKATFFKQSDPRRPNQPPRFVVRYGKRLDKPGLYVTKSYKTGEELERDKWIRDWNESLDKADQTNLNTMSAVDKAQLNVCLKKLDGTGVSILDCVDYYLTHNPVNSSKLSIVEAINIIKRWRIEVKNHPISGVNGDIMTTLRPFSNFVKNKQLRSITQQDCHNFLFSNKGWTIATMHAHKRNLSAFFGHLAKNNYPTINPAKRVELPDNVSKGPKVFYHAYEVWLFLDLCLSLNKHKLLASSILSAFCGGRMRESTRIKFNQIKWTQGLMVYYANQSKTKQRRCLYGNDVGMEWLRLVKRKNDDQVISSNYSIRKTLTELKKKVAHFIETRGGKASQGQNLLRQAFEAHAYYHFGFDLRAIAEVSGNSPETLKASYNGCLDEPKDADIYFNLFPRTTLVDGYQKALELDLWQSNHLDGIKLDDWTVADSKFKSGAKCKAEFLFHMPSVKEVPLHIDSPHWDGNVKKAIGPDGMIFWPDGSEGNPLGFDVKGNELKYKAIFTAVTFKLRYGFDPTDKKILLKIRDVRDYLIKNLGEDFLLKKA